MILYDWTERNVDGQDLLNQETLKVPTKFW